MAGGRFGETMFHPLGLALTLAMGVCLLLVPRSRVVLPLVIVACLVPAAQRIVIAGLDWNMVRIVVLFGWARVLFRGETRGFRFSRIDVAFCVWIVLGIVFFSMRELTLNAFVNRLGGAFDGIGVYFLFRIALRQPEDLYRSIQALAWISVPLVVAMALENASGRNFFAFLGGVAEYSIVREGEIRAQGAFSHPLMAAGFGATLLPLFLALRSISRGLRRRVADVGIACSLGITLLPSSGGALVVLLASVGAWFLWSLRYHLWMLRWGAVVMLVLIHLIREKPVWHLLARASNFTGGTGYHRYLLVDAFIHRWNEWMLWGVSSTRHWGWPQAGDITNQYILEGIHGGLATFVAFIVVLALSFSAAGRTVRRKHLPIEVRTLAWGIGVSLFAHAVFFMNVSYFGQMRALLFITLAMNGSLAMAMARRRSRAPVRAERGRPPSGEPGPADPQGALARTRA